MVDIWRVKERRGKLRHREAKGSLRFLSDPHGERAPGVCLSAGLAGAAALGTHVAQATKAEHTTETKTHALGRGQQPEAGKHPVLTHGRVDKHTSGYAGNGILCERKWKGVPWRGESQTHRRMDWMVPFT